MKVNFVSNLYPSDDFPYKGTFVKNIYEGFNSIGCKTHLIKLKDGNVNSFFKLINYLSFYLEMFFAALKANEREVFYVHYASHSSLGLLIASLFKSKKKLRIITNVHGSDVLPSNQSLFSKIKVLLSQKIVERSELVVAPSYFFQSILIKEFKVKEKKILVSPSGGVDASIFNSSCLEKEKKYTFGYVGRLEESKGIFDLLEAYKHLYVQNPDINLLIIGSGSMESRVQSFANEIDGVTMLGGKTQKELSEFYPLIKFLVFPSKARESLGLIPIEAMMCGVPVICSMTGATSEYIHSGMQSISFLPGDQEGLNSVMLESISMLSDEYIELSNLAVATANNYSSEKVISNLLTSFTSTIK
ncbi:glycosyltransferase family 4 protein [Aliivibrio fischeri]|uniref:glycosyltransferase family 4 protein n=1 Tax=Aliivibrio fischeri TaxID=668 RepID=UPI001F4206D5|nr:glycosyltransferase family 4 protein [Aliivibrio fischeri]MCE7556870.1 glycosyltransferase family 4 protein [Aliivibrio fischeri]MCE7563328.1 glycosyltransferase family 4 protein [Aliivibrio fischeri]MCE7570251.1 glycosyltransferase family 4 protein [Aliivibrio fischeri]